MSLWALWPFDPLASSLSLCTGPPHRKKKVGQDWPKALGSLPESSLLPNARFLPSPLLAYLRAGQGTVKSESCQVPRGWWRGAAWPKEK